MTANDTIYMVAPGGNILWWSYSPEVPLTAQPAYRTDRNEIAIVGLDLTYQWLDAKSGEVRWKARVGGGRAVYRDVKPFADAYLVVDDADAYLVVDDMEGYREGARAMGEPEGSDSLHYWGKIEDDNWHTDFPVGAALAVAGEHIYAVKYEEDKVVLQEIHPPPGKR